MSQAALHALGKTAPMPSRGEQTGSLTYEPHFGLQEKPFSLSADPRFLYRSRAHALAFTELSAAIRRREGLIVLTGGIGTGKTTLCRAVLQELDRRTFSAFVADPFLSREDLLHTLLVEFGVTSTADRDAGRLRGASRQDLSYRLYDFLNSLVPLQGFAVVVIDEAQNLSLPLLEEIRILADLEWREKLIQVVLVGQPELRARLKLPQLRQVEQRVSMRCELTALGREDVTAYVDYRLSVASGGPSGLRFTAGALDVVHHASAGIPRLINVICDRALHEAHGFRLTSRIEAAVVWKAIGALGLDVTPAAPAADPGTGMIGLGVLDPAEVAPLLETPAPVEAVVTLAVETEPPPTLTAVVVTSAVDSMEAFRSEAESGEPGAAPAAAAARPFMRRIVIASVLVAVLGVAAGGVAWYAGDPTIFTGGVSLSPDLPGRPILTPARAQVPRTAAVRRAAATELAAAIEEGRALPEVVQEGGFVLEVALFDSEARASRLVEQLTANDNPAYQTEVSLGPAGRRFVQVLAGPYLTRDEAETAVEAIRRMPGYEDARIRADSDE